MKQKTKLKIDILSDLHVDFWVKEVNPQHPKFQLKMAEFIDMILPKSQNKNLGDVLVLPGDIGHYNQQTMFLLIQLKKFYNEIIVTWGNHDMYLLSNNSIAKYKAQSSNRLVELKEICEGLDIHFLDGEVIEIQGVKFGGTGSWYNLPTAADQNHWKKIMNDSSKIYSGYATQPYGMYQSYSQPSTNWDSQKFYEEEKAKLIDISNKGCDIFITHVALNEPTLEQGMDPKYDMELVKKSGAKFHIHGHTHQHLEYIQDDIQVICNPLGYPGDNTYSIVKQIEI